MGAEDSESSASCSQPITISQRSYAQLDSSSINSVEDMRAQSLACHAHAAKANRNTISLPQLQLPPEALSPTPNQAGPAPMEASTSPADSSRRNSMSRSISSLFKSSILKGGLFGGGSGSSSKPGGGKQPPQHQHQNSSNSSSSFVENPASPTVSRASKDFSLRAVFHSFSASNASGLLDAKSVPLPHVHKSKGAVPPQPNSPHLAPPVQQKSADFGSLMEAEEARAAAVRALPAPMPCCQPASLLPWR